MVLLVVDTFVRHDDGVGNELTKDNEGYRYYNEFMWNKRYAECISLEETLARMN